MHCPATWRTYLCRETDHFHRSRSRLLGDVAPAPPKTTETDAALSQGYHDNLHKSDLVDSCRPMSCALPRSTMHAIS